MNLKHFGFVLFCGLAPAFASGASVELAADSPLLFEVNRGQTAPQVVFLSRAPGFTLFLTESEAVLRPAGSAESVRMRWPASSRPVGEQAASAKAHYFTHERKITDIESFSQVRYPQAAPDIDIVFYPRLGGLEYDFVVSAGADPRRAVLTIDAPGGLHIDDGRLVMAVGSGAIHQRRPVAYQVIDGERRPVEADFVLLAENKVGFELGEYDSARDLVIDPFIEYASYLGRGDEEEILDIVAGPDGSLYATGYTASSNFPILGAADPEFDGDEDAFVLRFDASGSSLAFSTFLGGGGNDRGTGIALGPDGSIYISGDTRSDDLATDANSFQRTFGGGDRDGFAAKLSGSGSTLLYLTYLGDTDEDWANDVAVQSTGVACYVGGTRSSQFPVTDAALQRGFGGDPTDGYVTCLSEDGARAEVSSFVGADRDDEVRSIAVGPDDSLSITGQTRSNNFQTSSLALQSERAGGLDAFYARLDSSGSRLLYSTFLGGGDDEFGNAVTVDPFGAAYVGGLTQSDNFPVSELAFQRAYGTGGDGFVAKFDRNGARMYSTYLGGDDEDAVNALAVNGNGWVSAVGHTKSEDFPVVAPGALQAERADSDGDAFWSRLDERGRTLLDSTFLGGRNRDEAFAVALDGLGGVFIAGRTSSRDFPVNEAAFQPGRADAGDGFVARIVDNLELSTVSGASFDGEAPVAPESIVSAFGVALAPASIGAQSTPLPAVLGGVNVQVRDSAGFDRTAALFFVSPAQINFEVPPGTADGVADVTVLRDGQPAASGVVRVRRTAPSIFTANADGTGAPAGLVARFNGGTRTDGFTFSSGAQGARQPAAINVSGSDRVIVTLFATGVRFAEAVEVTVDGESQTVLFAGEQSEFVGLDQVNVDLSSALAGRGLVDLELFADGRRANTVQLLLQ